MASLLYPDEDQSQWPTSLLPADDGTPPVLQPDPRADALGQTYRDVSDYLARQQAKSEAEGYWTGGGLLEGGHPTGKGMSDALDHYGQAVLLGSTTPRAVPPAFQAWFGASKVATPEGMPLQVYHGTNAPGFEAFDPATAGAKTGNVTTPLGHFFTDQPGEASRYATAWGNEGGNVRPTYLSIQNPYEMPHSEFDKLAMSVFRGQKTESEAMADSAALRQDLIDRGHDGIVIRGRGMRPSEYVAFHPEQIAPAMKVDAASGQPEQ